MVQTRLLGTTCSLWPLEYICSIFVVWWSGRLSTSLQGFWTSAKSIWASLGRVPFAFCLSRSWGRDRGEGGREREKFTLCYDAVTVTLLNKKKQVGFSMHYTRLFFQFSVPFIPQSTQMDIQSQTEMPFIPVIPLMLLLQVFVMGFDCITHTAALSLYNRQKHSAFVPLALTFSTSLNTRRKLCLRTPDNSFSVQCLFSSSWIRAGYLDTSSNPRGNLQTVEHNRLCITQTLRTLKMQLLSVTSLLTKKWVILIAFKLEHNVAVLMN